MPRTNERAEIIAALGLEPEGRGKSDRYNMTLAELRNKLKAQGARSKATPKSDSYEPKRITDNDVNAAVSVIKADYYQDVRDIGDDLKSRIKDGEITDEDELRERLQEDVDGLQRVIYTFQAKLGLLSSDNEDAYENEFATKPDTVEAAMSMAMQRDVEEYLGDVSDLFNGGDDED